MATTVHDKRKNAQRPFGVAEETNKFVDGVIHISCICSIYLFLPRVVILPSYNSLDSIETMYREGDWKRTKHAEENSKS